jgi:heptose-I-phosphate ethanolaminephosphotransferase
VVSRLIQSLRDADSYGFLLYLADHGEEVFDEQRSNFIGRSEMAPTAGMYDIPFILWTSPRWREHHQLEQFVNYVDRPYSTAYFIHSWADLAGLRFVGFDEKQSIVNASFVPPPLWIGDP